MSVLRALFFLSDFGGGGAQKTLLNLAGAMDADALQVEFAVADSRGPAARWVPSGLSIHDLGGRSGMARSIPALARLIKVRQPDVILSTMVHANIATWMASCLTRSNAALVLRETNSHRAQSELSTFHRMLAGIAYRRADLVIALSEGVRRELVEDMGLPPSHTVTIPNPVDVAKIRSQIARVRRQASPFPGMGGKITILGIGRLVRQKAYEILINAVARHVPEANIVLLGEGSDRSALEHQAIELGIGHRLFMPGFVDDVNPYIAHSDIFALSSRWEGFGHVIVEAMAGGLPVVAADCPYGPADIIDHEKTGLLVPSDDADALGRALRLMIDKPALARKLSKAADIAADRFESSRIAVRYCDALMNATIERAARSR